jgi:hypothetical protein
MEFANKLVELAQFNAMMLLYLSEKELFNDFMSWQQEKMKCLTLYSE